MSLLKSGDSILLDFDGELTDITGLKYPEIGPVRIGMSEFLVVCQRAGIKVWIWSARGNYNPEFHTHSLKGLEVIKDFMKNHNLPYAGIYTGYKPLGSGTKEFKFLLDDKAAHFENGYDAINKLLMGD